MIISSVQFSRSVTSNSLWPHRLQDARLPCPSPTPGACSNSCPSIQWCHPTILSSVVPFSSCLQSFPASGSLPMNQFFSSGGQSIGASASVLPMNIQDWFPSELTGLITLQSKRLSSLLHHSSKASVISLQFSSVQLLSRVRLFATPWVAASQAFLALRISSTWLFLSLYLRNGISPAISVNRRELDYKEGWGLKNW